MITLTAVALALRLIGIDFGRPFVYHPDEWIVAQPAIAMVERGDWEPQLYWYPSAMLYAERLLVGVVHAATEAPLEADIAYGFDTLAFRGYNETVPEQFPFYLAGRILVALLGAVTVALAFVAGRALAGQIGGLIAALVMAIAPLAVRHGHFLTPDVPSTMFATASLALALLGRDLPRLLTLAGLCAGLAASTKYNAGAVVIVPLVIALLALEPPTARLRRAGGVAIALVAGFVALTPIAVIDPVAILDALRYQVDAYSATTNAGLPANLVHYVGFLGSSSGLGLALALMSGVGAIVAIHRRRRGELAVLGFVLVYLLIVSTPAARFERNLLPVLPGLAVLTGLAGAAMTGLAGPRLTMSRAAVLALALVGIGVAQAGTGILVIERSLAGPDTRTMALNWATEHIPAGSRIVRETYTPQLSPDQYQVGVVGRLSEHPVEWYHEQGVDYLIASSYRFGQGATISPPYAALLGMPIVFDASAELQPRIVIIDIRTP